MVELGGGTPGVTAVVLPLKLQVGARTLATIRRRLVRVPFSLDRVLADTPLHLPALDRTAHGYLVTSLPAALAGQVEQAVSGAVIFVRQRYVRYHADLSIGYDAWLAQMSANARATMKRKARKLAEVAGGTLDIRAYRTADDLAVFHDLARTVSATTYQERLLGSGLPDDESFQLDMTARAAADQVRAWLLMIGDRPVAYLWCAADGESLRYDYVGHDPAFAALSPGAVLQAAAMRDLYGERRFRRFDFTEGEGQHKRQFATGGTACIDLLILRPSLANRAVVGALKGFDAGVALAKRGAGHPVLAGVAKRVRR